MLPFNFVSMNSEKNTKIKTKRNVEKRFSAISDVFH